MQKEFILRFILTDIEHKQLFYDSKTILQEIVQASHKEELGYRLVKRKDRTTTNTLWQRHMSATGSSDRAKAGPKRDRAGSAYRGILKLREEQS